MTTNDEQRAAFIINYCSRFPLRQLQEQNGVFYGETQEHYETWQAAIAPERGKGGAPELSGVAEVLEEAKYEGVGFWHTCSGCYEGVDGQNVHGYPHSDIFKCVLGSGCRECGGIGATWDTTDYEDMALASLPRPRGDTMDALQAETERLGLYPWQHGAGEVE